MILLAACAPFGPSPEGRARDFIETLVRKPSEVEQLRDIANLSSGRHPEDLLGDLSARVGLDYLRVMQQRDVSLKFVPGDTQRVTAGQQTVKVHVTWIFPGTPSAGEVRFLVGMEQENPGHWRISRVLGDN